MRLIFVILCFLYGTSSFCQFDHENLQVGLTYQYNQEKAILKVNKGSYKVFTQAKIIDTIFEGESIVINSSSKVSIGNKTYDFLWLRLDILNDKSILNFNRGYYKGSFRIYVLNKKIEIVNSIDLETYVENVLKNESGYGKPIEYYKVQAIISRTYALKNHKHKKEGYDLCNSTHCQVYKSINYHKPIREAVKQTQNKVIINGNLNLISTYFSANCGGLTSYPEDVWKHPIEYMQCVEDTFCIKMDLATWQKTISKASWKNYIVRNTNLRLESLTNQNFNWTQYPRVSHYVIKSRKIKLTKIRSDWKLRSTFFDIEDKGQNLILKGRGFGHGVGICQEGAINMAENNISYDKIIHHYYQNVFIIDWNKRLFFKYF